MDTADQFVKEIFSWITQGEKYADKLKKLAGRLESGSGGRNTQEHLTEVGNTLKAINKTVTRIRELFKELKEKKKLNSNPDPKDPEDPEKLHRLILADVLMALGRHGKLDMSNIDQLPERLIKFLANLGFSHILTSFCVVLFTFKLETGSESFQILARSRSMEASGGVKLAGVGAMAYFLPEAIDSWSDQIENNHVTEASRSLRSRAEQILEIIRELRKQFSIIEESIRKLNGIKNIRENINKNQYEKNTLVDYTKNTFKTAEVQQWLNDTKQPDVLPRLEDLVVSIYNKLKKKVRNKKKTELIFLAHGSIEDQMIPASSLLPPRFITDVLLYSPWNCFLSAEAAYGIAKGTIRPDADPDHRQFKCTSPCDGLTEGHPHKPPNLPRNWNSMRISGSSNIPKIMVSPVGEQEGEMYTRFTDLMASYGEPRGKRVVFTYKAPDFDILPFSDVMLAISVVLSFFECEATVHLAAHLIKSPKAGKMQEEHLSQQYAYTVDNTTMTVPEETFS
ncbi:uncharacterized protein LOC106963491 [Poecilia latipinna]|uniref:uncharacterized protein LOC106963491 n=1 Tax=Poecilia latipinna TaxID=48699 RepID=UPI00072EDAD7|nr:PREDICTED: uncharacterized protein LOC106963491 [Poecilia latipinna]